MKAVNCVLAHSHCYYHVAALLRRSRSCSRRLLRLKSSTASCCGCARRRGRTRCSRASSRRTAGWRRARAEAVLQVLRDAGLVLRVNLTKDGAKLLLVFVTADLVFEQQSQRLFIERWLQEGIGDTMGEHGSGSSIAARRAATKPAMRIVRVGGLHYFASDPKQQQQQQQQQQQPAAGGPPSTFKVTRRGGSSCSTTSCARPSRAAPASRRCRRSRRRRRDPGGLPAARRALERRAVRRARRVNLFIPSSRDAFLREVRGQFGEKVAFYFAFNCFYTSWLLVRRAPGATRRTPAQFSEHYTASQVPPSSARCSGRSPLRRVAAAARAAVRHLHRDMGVGDDEGVAALREQARARLGRRQPAAGRGDPQGVRGWARTSAITGERAALPSGAAPSSTCSPAW